MLHCDLNVKFQVQIFISYSPLERICLVTDGTLGSCCCNTNDSYRSYLQVKKHTFSSFSKCLFEKKYIYPIQRRTCNWFGKRLLLLEFLLQVVVAPIMVFLCHLYVGQVNLPPSLPHIWQPLLQFCHSTCSSY